MLARISKQVAMLLQKQRNLCLRLQYILYLQYNKQWYQIAREGTLDACCDKT